MKWTQKQLNLALATVTVALGPWILQRLGAPLALAIGIALAISLAVLILLLREFSNLQALRNRQVLREVRQQYRQQEALLVLTDYLRPNAILPATRGWAASPDLLAFLCRHLARERPRHVLELGSGVSTLVLAYCLKRQGAGRLTSLEHDAEMAERTRRWLEEHGLEDFAEVRLAPLVPVQLDDEEWSWYDLSELRLDDPVDFLFVDGPPARQCVLARYPALELLTPNLTDRATIVLDDGAREGEAEIARRWSRSQDLACDYRDLEKGAFVLRRKARQ